MDGVSLGHVFPFVFEKNGKWLQISTIGWAYTYTALVGSCTEV